MNYGTRRHALRYGHNYPVRRKIFDFNELIKFGINLGYCFSWYFTLAYDNPIQVWKYRFHPNSIDVFSLLGILTNIFFEYRFQPRIFGIRAEIGTYFMPLLGMNKFDSNRACFVSPAVYLRFYPEKTRNFCLFLGMEFNIRVMEKRYKKIRRRFLNDDGEFETEIEDLTEDREYFNRLITTLMLGMDVEIKGYIWGLKFGTLLSQFVSPVGYEELGIDIDLPPTSKEENTEPDHKHWGIIAVMYLGYDFAYLLP